MDGFVKLINGFFEKASAFVKANAVPVIAAVVAFFIVNFKYRSSDSALPALVAIGVFFVVRYGLAAFKK